MRKGRLIEQILSDHTIRWDAIYNVLHWKGRHRHKKRWRRTLIAEALCRAFPRGGRRPAPAATPSPMVATAALPPPPPGGDPTTPSPSPSASSPSTPPPLTPTANAEPSDDLGEIATAEVWRRFHTVFPVLSLYRTAWNSQSPVARASPPDSPVSSRYEAAWKAAAAADGGGATLPLPLVAQILGWPAGLTPSLPLVVLLAARLWPSQPWGDWAADDGATLRRAAVPFVRRAACLVHGFAMGGCDPRGVWEAIELPRRSG